MKIDNDKEKIFAALKLIECLVIDGKLEKYVFKNILKEYASIIDISQFRCYN